MTSHLDSDFLSRLRSSVGSASAAPPTPESINSSFNSASKKNNDSYVVNEMSFSSYKQKLNHGNVNSKHQDEYGGIKTPSRTDPTNPTVGLTPQVQTPLPYTPVETDSPFINNSANQDAQYATKFTPKSKKGYIISPSLFSPTSPIMPSSSSSSSSSSSQLPTSPLSTLSQADYLAAKTDAFVKKLREGGSGSSSSIATGGGGSGDVLTSSRMLGRDNVSSMKYSSRRTLQVTLREVILNGAKVGV
jgi:hypothetical protein